MATKKQAEDASADSPAEEQAKEEKGDVTTDELMAAEQAKGFVGDETDPTPNENYTVAGQGAGLPVPETDEDLAAEAKAATKKS